MRQRKSFDRIHAVKSASRRKFVGTMPHLATGLGPALDSCTWFNMSGAVPPMTLDCVSRSRINFSIFAHDEKGALMVPDSPLYGCIIIYTAIINHTNLIEKSSNS